MIQVINSQTSVKIINGTQISCFDKGELIAYTSEAGYVNIKNNRKSREGALFWEFFKYPLDKITDVNNYTFGLTDETAIKALNLVFSTTAGATRKQLFQNVDLTMTPTTLTHGLNTPYFQVLCFDVSGDPIDLITTSYTDTTINVSSAIDQSGTTILLIG